MVRGGHHGQDHLQQHAVSGWRDMSGRRGILQLFALLRCFWGVGMECACAESSSAACCQCSAGGIRFSALCSLVTNLASITAPSLLAADHAVLSSPVHWPAACIPTSCPLSTAA